MRLLLDTHLLLQPAALQRERLLPRTRILLKDGVNELIFGPSSLWEVAIKRSNSRADFPFDVGPLHRALLLHHFTEMPVNGIHAVYVARLALLKPPSIGY